MDHFIQEKTFTSSQLGFHYFHEDEGFKQQHAHLWLEKLKETNAKWLVVNNPSQRAIPEEFIRVFSSADINLIINFNEVPSSDFDLANIMPILRVYGKWGIKYTCLFQPPNLISSWGEYQWNTRNVVKAHTEKFIEFSELCLENNIKPIFSLLFPGGDFWDLAFLEESLKELAEHAEPRILNNIILSSYGWMWGNPIDWGVGGKRKWPQAAPFQNDPQVQNQKGFRNFEWQLEVSEKVLGKKLPMVVFEADRQNKINPRTPGETSLPQENISIIPALLAGRNVYDPAHPDQLLSPISSEVIACCLYVQPPPAGETISTFRWFSSSGNLLETEKIFAEEEKKAAEISQDYTKRVEFKPNNMHFKYGRYILISDSLKSEMPTLLADLDPYIRKYQPRIGFSKSEALNAAYILVITKNKSGFSFSEYENQSIKSVIKVVTPNEIKTQQGETTYEQP